CGMSMWNGRISVVASTVLLMTFSLRHGRTGRPARPSPVARDLLTRPDGLRERRFGGSPPPRRTSTAPPRIPTSSDSASRPRTPGMCLPPRETHGLSPSTTRKSDRRADFSTLCPPSSGSATCTDCPLGAARARPRAAQNDASAWQRRRAQNRRYVLGPASQGAVLVSNLGQTEFMATYLVNKRAVAKARDLIDAHQYRVRS